MTSKNEAVASCGCTATGCIVVIVLGLIALGAIVKSAAWLLDHTVGLL